MKFLIILFGFFFSSSLAFKTVFQMLQENLEHSLNALSRQTVNEPGFPKAKLSEEFMEENKLAIQNTLYHYHELKKFLLTRNTASRIEFNFARYETSNRAGSGERINGDYQAIDDGSNEGFGRVFSIMSWFDRHYKRGELVFKDDGMLIALLRSKYNLFTHTLDGHTLYYETR